jgi:hypothetical protein
VAIVFDNPMSVYRSSEYQEPKPPDPIAEMVAARDCEHRALQAEATRVETLARHREIERLARRTSRVSVDGNRITIARPPMRELLLEGLDDAIFLAVLPGGIAYAGAAGLLWLLTSMSYAVACLVLLPVYLATAFALHWWNERSKMPTWYLDVTDEHFALHTGEPREAALYGRLHELRIRLSDPDPARLHYLRLEHDGEVEFEKLTLRDNELLRAVLSQRFRF